MDNQKFVDLCKKAVVEYNYRNKTAEGYFSPEEVYVVWLSKTLQNNKALLSTNIPDGRYYEVTYDGDKGIAYVDSYKKEGQIIV